MFSVIADRKGDLSGGLFIGCLVSYLHGLVEEMDRGATEARDISNPFDGYTLFTGGRCMVIIAVTILRLLKQPRHVPLTNTCSICHINL